MYFPRLISRRGFLKIGAASLLGSLWPLAGWSRSLASPKRAFTDISPDQLGRVIDEKITVYDRPSREGSPVKDYWRDSVFQITDVTVGDENPPYNRVWYRAGEDGFVHSGSIQPVKTNPAVPVLTLPPEGAWAEVSVPFTDVYWELGRIDRFAYRLYYETVHWVETVVYDSAGIAWYQVLEDKRKQHYFAPATHLRVIPLEELGPLSPNVPPEAKRIEVLIREQVAIAYEYNVPIFMARAATGAKLREGNFSTPVGTHITFCKRAGRHMAAGDPASNGYDLPGVPWICYITENGLAFHGTYWHNDYGKRRSHGCVNLTPQAAKWIYRWTQPVVPPLTQQVYENYGTRVDVIDTSDEDESEG